MRARTHFGREFYSGAMKWSHGILLMSCGASWGKNLRKKANYSRKYNIVLVLNCDADFRLLQSFAINVPYEDYESLGLDEIWLGDYRGVRTGAHCSIALFGLYPNDIRELTERPGWDMKRFA